MSLIAGMRKNYGPDLTSYDVLKTVALLLMVCDHLGYFFFPEHDWLRVLGRFSAPIWFFLIGYTGTREVPRNWWIGGAIITFSAIAVDGYLFPLSILFTLALTRMYIDQLGAFAMRGVTALSITFLLLVVLALPTTTIIEYGTFGVLCALYGYMRRHETALQMDSAITAGFITGLVVASVCFQAFLLPVMDQQGYLALGGGMAAIFIGLNAFRPAVWPKAMSIAPNPVILMQFLGRWTLEIYVIHLVLFRIAAFFFSPMAGASEAFEIFGFKFW